MQELQGVQAASKENTSRECHPYVEQRGQAYIDDAAVCICNRY